MRPIVTDTAHSPPRGALSGLRIVDLTTVILGPYATMLLADLGAEVIKIERLGTGDQARTMPGAGHAGFYHFNRNKRSLAVDLKSDKGKALVSSSANKCCCPNACKCELTPCDKHVSTYKPKKETNTKKSGKELRNVEAGDDIKIGSD